jgi:hypothetical protein
VLQEELITLLNINAQGRGPKNKFIPCLGNWRNQDCPVRKLLSRVALISFVCVIFAIPSYGQDASVNITLLSAEESRIRITGQLPAPTSVWSFRNSVTSLSQLADRIDKFKLKDEKGLLTEVRKLGPGEYTALRPATHFEYEVLLNPPQQPETAPHVSWLSADFGLLLLGDLLPIGLRNIGTGAKGVLVKVDFPPTWTAVSNDQSNGPGDFIVRDVQNGVIAIGRNMRVSNDEAPGIRLQLATLSDWAFTDNEVLNVATKIGEQHAKVFGSQFAERATLVLLPFPSTVAPGRWSAVTTGRTIILLSGRQPSQAAALSQLTVSLTHEVMHLWVPNGLALDGDYDWFYEGFTLYQALIVGLRSGLFTFDDYLNALARAFDTYRRDARRDAISLPELSTSRWAGSASLIYNKGLLVAALYDLELRAGRNRKQTLDGLYRELLMKHASGSTRADGSRTIIDLLKMDSRTTEFVSKFVEGRSAIDLAAALSSYGLTVETNPVRTHIRVQAKLDKAQKTLLKELGYNSARR